MKKLFVLAALACVSVMAETQSRTIYMNRDNVPFQIPGPVAESVMVIVTTNNPAVKAYRVTISYTAASGQRETKTQIIDRATGQFVVSSVANFLVDRISNLQPAIVEPLGAMAEQVIAH